MKPKTNTVEVGMNLINIKSLQKGVEFVGVTVVSDRCLAKLLLATTTFSTPF